MKPSILRLGVTAQIVLAFFALVMWSPTNAATPLSSEQAFDSRVVRLDHPSSQEAGGHLVVTALTPAGGRHIDVYAADGDGAPFRPIGRISDPVFATGVCCGTLYELPRPMGSLREGTLLWAG